MCEIVPTRKTQELTKKEIYAQMRFEPEEWTANPFHTVQSHHPEVPIALVEQILQIDKGNLESQKNRIGDERITKSI